MTSDLKFYFFRYFSYGFIAIEMLLIPIILSKESYGELEWYKSIALLGSYSLFGSFSGYIYYKYTLKKDLYEALFTYGLFSSILVSSICSFLFSKFSYLLIIPFFVNALSIIQEKKLQVSNHFILSILFKPILSLVLVICFIYSYSFKKINIEISILFIFVYLISYFLWTFLSTYLSGEKVIIKFHLNLKSNFYQYCNLIKYGFIINLSTIALSLLLFNYRNLVFEYFTSDLAGFSLAFNIALFVFLGINTYGYLLTVRIGEEIDSIIKSTLKKYLKNGFLVFILLFFVGLSIIYIYDNFIVSFDNIMFYYLVITIFVGSYYVFSIISPVLLYRNTINQSTLFFVFILIIDYISNIYLLKLDMSSFQILSKSGILLLMSSTYNLYLIFNKSKIEN
tara:strand:+ start:222 stop:1406 length:1185 start_codon:yes stop_codon:yes gene_type:complete